MRVPVERYTSQAWLERELERVFGQVWLLAAHGSELARPGDFVVFEIAGESFIVVRDERGTARAHANVCQHRGTALCSQASGHATRFRCPYHHWEYALDGALVSAPGAGPAAEAVRLTPVACEERSGFVWISMATNPGSLDEWLAPVFAELARYRPEEYRLVNENCVEVAANWKASVDVNNESYHLATLHPELLDAIDVRSVREELRGPHSITGLALGQPSRDVPDDAPVPEALGGFFTMMTGQTLPSGVCTKDVRVALATALRSRSAAVGIQLEDFTDEGLTTKQQVQLFPNVQLNFTPLGLELYRHRPHPVDPGRCWFDELTFVRPGSKVLPAPTRHRFVHGQRDLGPVMGADVDLLPRLQAGMRSKFFTSLRLTPREASIANLHRELERLVGKETP